MITKEQIYAATHGGIDYIKEVYPDVSEVLLGNKKHFRMRDDERTPSASVRQKDGVWYVHDFGLGESWNAISLCMAQLDFNFPSAIAYLAARYNIMGVSPDVNKPDIHSRAALDTEADGLLEYILNDDFTEAELKILVPVGNTDKLAAVKEACKVYGWHSIKSYTLVKTYKDKQERKVYTFSSTPSYPIFMRECVFNGVTFRKFYSPLSYDKAHRFFYDGAKPAGYINGLDVVEAAHAKINAQAVSEHNDEGRRDKDKRFVDPKLDDDQHRMPVVLCSGERDALCAYVYGCFPLWLNSETAKITTDMYLRMSRYSNRLYNIPDADKTGFKAGITLAMKYLDIYTVELPSWLFTFKDIRGNYRKDLRDYLELRPNKSDFHTLIKLAKPMRFWEYITSGRDKLQRRPEINPEYLLFYLSANGFATIEDKGANDGHSLVKITENVIERITPKDIRADLIRFVRERSNDLAIVNLVHTSTRINKDLYYSLPAVTPNFKDFDRDQQYFFFENRTVQVTPAGVRYIPKGTTPPADVWKQELIPHCVSEISPSFEADSRDITIHNLESNYFKVLIQTSRVHWRREFEEELDRLSPADRDNYISEHKYNISGPLLTDVEKNEQKRHLLNKIFSIGYLLHRYKSDSRAWCVYAMDAKIDIKNSSNGRSGKSFCIKFLRNFMNTATLSGRNKNLTNNPHIYERITEHTDMAFVDDGTNNLDFDFFFPAITGDLDVNPKNNRSFEVSFENSPKFVITSNYVLRNSDPSTEGRLLYMVFSDYYHQTTAGDNEYRENRSIRDDVGKDLFRSDYSQQEWNADINFLMECCAYYLKVSGAHKITPPMENVISRMNIQRMGGQIFADWADAYFAPEGENLDKIICKKIAQDAFLMETNTKWTSQRFKEALRYYCKFKGYDFNPLELCTGTDEAEREKTRRIISRLPSLGTKECIYIKTKQHIAVPQDLPF